jgi:membrane protease YdiL (CAAX protease family)
METSLKSSRLILWRNRILSLVFVGVVYYGLWDFAFSWLWYRVTPHLGMTPELLASHPWIQLYANHLWEIVIALPLIILLGGKQWHVWSGLNLRQSRLSLNIFWRALIFVIPFHLVLLIISLVQGQTPSVSYPFTSINILGWLSFQLLLSGPAEEILFRGLFQSFLCKFWPEILRLRKVDIPVAGLITAVIFALVHINFTLTPFAITHFDIGQLITAFGFGLFYSMVYHKTGSLLCPILTHSISNIVSIGILYIFILLT